MEPITSEWLKLDPRRLR